MLRQHTSLGQRLAALPTLLFLGILASGCGSSAGSHSATDTSASSTSSSLSSPASLAPIRTPYKPRIDPASFVRTIDNPYFPLKPGTGFHYKGVRGTMPQT